MPEFDDSFDRHYFEHGSNVIATVYGSKADMARLRTIIHGRDETFDILSTCQQILAFDNITPIERELAARLLSMPARIGRLDNNVLPFIADQYDENTMDHIAIWSYDSEEIDADAAARAKTTNALTLYLEEQLLSQYFHDFNSVEQPIPSCDVIGVVLARMEMGAYVAANDSQNAGETREEWLRRLGKQDAAAREYIDNVTQVVNKWLADNRIHHSTHDIVASKNSPIGGVSYLEFHAIRR